MVVYIYNCETANTKPVYVRIRLDRFDEPILILVVRKKGQNRENWKKKRKGREARREAARRRACRGRPVYVLVVWVGTLGARGVGV